MDVGKGGVDTYYTKVDMAGTVDDWFKGLTAATWMKRKAFSLPLEFALSDRPCIYAAIQIWCGCVCLTAGRYLQRLLYCSCGWERLLDFSCEILVFPSWSSY
jgi:hypothetical protein